jgi:hypothetical protein
MIVEVLSQEGQVANWYDEVPKDVRDEITRLEATEEVKSWISPGSRDKSALMTLPQLLKVIEENWKEGFDDLIRDKGLTREARLLGSSLPGLNAPLSKCTMSSKWSCSHDYT